jgi:hypothetical protein
MPSLNAARVVVDLDVRGHVHLVAIGDKEGDAALVADLSLAVANEVRPDGFPVALRFGKDGREAVRVEVCDHEKLTGSPPA